MAAEGRRVYNLFKVLCRNQPCTRIISGAVATTKRTLPTCFPQAASLHSLPGNRAFLLHSSPWSSSHRLKSTNEADTRVSMSLGVVGIEEAEDYTPLSDRDVHKGITTQINTSLEEGEMGRLYAVVYVRGMQFKVTSEDLIVVKNNFPPNVGDRIRLEKVLAVGGKDFTLFGQPLLSPNVVKVEATVVEKTLSHNKVWFTYQKRKNTKTFYLVRDRHTVLVINSIQVAKLQGDDKESTSKTVEE